MVYAMQTSTLFAVLNPTGHNTLAGLMVRMHLGRSANPGTAYNLQTGSESTQAGASSFPLVNS